METVIISGIVLYFTIKIVRRVKASSRNIDRFLDDFNAEIDARKSQQTLINK